MKTRKRLMSVLCAMALALSMSACTNTGDDEKQEEKGNVVVNDENQDEAGNVVVNDDNQDEAENSVDDDENQDEAGDSDSEDETSGEFTRGSVDDDVYINEYADLSFKLPDSWEFYSDEDLAAIMNIAIDSFDNISDFQKELTKVQTIYDMMATDSLTGENVIVMYENLGLLGKSSMTADEYADALSQQMNQVQTDFAYNFEKGEPYMIGDNEYAVLKASVDMQVASVYQTYLMRKVGDYMLCICISGNTEDYYDNIIGNFS